MNKFLAVVAVLSLVFSPVTPAFAATYYWDTNGATAGFGTAGGTWGSSNYISTDSTGSSATAGTATTTNDSMNFGSGTAGLAAGTVGITGTRNSGNINFFALSGAITLSGGTAINLAAATNITVSNAIDTISTKLTGAATSLSKMGTGTLILSGNNTYAGQTNIAAGTLKLGSTTALGAVDGGAVTVSSEASLDLNGQNLFTTTKDLSIAGTGVGGNGALLTSTGSASYSGEITLTAASTIATLSTGTENMYLYGGVVTDSGKDVTFNIADSADAITILNTGISGAGNVIKEGAGSLLYWTPSSYTGSTAINAGTLELGDANVIPDGTAVTIASGAALSLNGYNDTIGSLSGAGTVKNNNADRTAVLIVGDADSTIFSGSIIDGSTKSLGLTKQGAGTLTLSGANTYTGTTTISAGTLQIGNNNTTGSLSPSSAIVNNATLSFDRTNTITQGTDFAPVISGTGAVRQEGSGTLVLNGANNYSGGTTLLAGTTKIGNATAIGTGRLTLNGGTIDTNGADITLTTNNTQTWNGSFTFAGTNNLNLGTGAVTLAFSPIVTVNAGKLTVGGNISGNHDLTKAGNGTLTLSGAAANTYTGDTTISAGELQLNKNEGVTAINGNVSIEGGVLTWLASDQLDNLSSVTMTSGTMNLNGHDEWIASFENSGGTFMTGTGDLIVDGERTVRWSGGTNTINAGGMVSDSHFVITGGTNTVEGLGTGVENGGVLAVDAFGDGLEMSNGSTLTLNSDNVSAGKLWLYGDVSTSGDSTVTIATAGSGSIAGTINLEGGARTFTVANGAASTDLAISATLSNGGLTKAGAGTMLLTGANTYAGVTTIGGGVLNAGAGDVAGISGSLGNGGDITFTGGTLQYSTASAGTDYAARIKSSTGIIKLDTNGQDVTLGGIIDDSNVAGLTKLGAGLLTLSGANTYVGNTTIAAGTLRLAADQASSLYMFASDAVLKLADDVALTADILAVDNNDNGTLIFEGSGSVTGDIGDTIDALKAVTLNGMAGTTATINGDVYAYDVNIGAGTLYMDGNLKSPSEKTVRFSDDGVLRMADGGTVDSNIETAADGTGTLAFEGDGEVTGQIGDVVGEDNFYLKAINVAQLSDVAAEEGYLVDLGTGSANSVYVNSLNFGYADQDTGWDTEVAFRGDAIIGQGGEDDGIFTDSDDYGIVTFYGDATINGDVGSTSKALYQINLEGAGKTLTLNGDVHASADTTTRIFFNAAGQEVKITDRQNISADIYGYIDGGIGSTLTFEGSANFTGTIGAVVEGTYWMAMVNLDGGADTMVTVTGDINAGEVNIGDGTLYMNGTLTSASGTVHFTDGTDGTLELAVGNTIDSEIVTDTAGGHKGTLAFDGAGTVTGTVGQVAAPLKAVISNGTGTVNFGGVVYADTFTLKGGDLTGAKLTSTGGTFDFRSGSAANVLAGVGAVLNKTTSDAVTLSGVNTYTGGTTLTAGTLNINNARALGTGTVSIADGTTIDCTAGGAGITLTSVGAQTWNGNFTFKGTDDLNLGTGTVALGAATRTVSTTAGTLTVGGVISGGAAAGLTKAGAGILALTGANAYTGKTTVNEGALSLDFSAAGAPATNIINGSSALVLGGGTLSLTGKGGATNSQTFGGLTLNDGNSAIVLTSASDNQLVLNLGNIVNNHGATISFTLPTDPQTLTNGITTTRANDETGILGTWATVSIAGGSAWAVSAGDGEVAGNITALTDYEDITARGGIIPDNPDLNVRIQGDGPVLGGDITLANPDTTVNTLLQNNATIVATVDTDGGVLRTNGIMVSTNAENLVIGDTFSSVGTLTAGYDGGDLVLSVNNPDGILAVNSVIANNGSASSLIKSGDGTLDLNNVNTYTGSTIVGAGTLYLAQSLTASSGLIFSGDATVELAGGKSITPNITTEDNGSGTLAFLGNGDVAGNVGAEGAYLGTISVTNEGDTVNFGTEGAPTKVYANHLLFDIDGVPTYTTVTFYGDTYIGQGGEGDGITTDNPNKGIVNFNGNATITGESDGEGGYLVAIGSLLKNLNEVNFNGGAGTTATVNGDIYAIDMTVGAGTLELNGSFFGGGDTLDFTGDGEVVLANGKSIGSNITTEANGTGTLTFEGDGVVSAKIGGNDFYLKTINVAQGGDYDVSLKDDVFVNKLNFGPDNGEGGGDTFVTITGDATIGSGGITTEWAGYGVVEFDGNATVAGQVGAPGAYLWEINVANDGAAEAVTFNSPVYTSSLNFFGNDGNVPVTFNDKAMIGDHRFEGSGIMTDSDGNGSVTFNSNATVTGWLVDGDYRDAIGDARNALDEVYINGAAGTTVTVNGDVHANDVYIGAGTLYMNGDLTTPSAITVRFTGDGFLRVTAGHYIDSNIVTDTDGTGTLTFGGGDNIVFGNIGGANALKAVNLTGTSGVTVTGDLHTYNVTLGTNALTVGGEFEQKTGGTLNLTINSAAAYGNVDVDNTTTVAAGNKVCVTVPTGASLANGTQFAIITVNSSAENDIAVPTVTSSTRRYTFTASVDGATGDLILTSAEGNYTAPAGASGNAGAVGDALNSITNPTGDMNDVLNQLGTLSDSQYVQALESMHPDVSSGAAEGGRALTHQGFTTISNRLGGARDGFVSAGVSAGEMLNGVGVWMQALGSHLKQDMRKGIEGFAANTFGTTIGADKVIDSHFRAGFAGSYGWAGVKAKTAGSPSDNINSYQATLYGSYDSLDLEKSRQGGKKSYEAVRSQVENSYYVDGMMAFTQDNYDSRREIWVTPTSGRVAKADHYAQQYSTNFEAGYKFVFERTKALEVTPFASLGYNYLYMNQYKEHGADALNLNVNGEGFHQLEQALGTKVAYPITCKKMGTFIPSGKAAWLYDYIGDRFETTASFAGGGSSFNTKGAKVAKNGMLFGAELAFLNKGNMTVTGNWDIELKDQYMSNTYYGTVRYDF